MKCCLSWILFVFLLNIGYGGIFENTNVVLAASSSITNQNLDEEYISYEDLDMFKSVAEYGELSESELRKVVMVLKDCGIIDSNWTVSCGGGTPTHQWDGYKPESRWDKLSRTVYTYTRKNIDIGYRTFAKNPSTGNMATRIKDIKFTINILVDADTKTVESVKLGAYSYLGGMFFSGYDYPIADKYTKGVYLHNAGESNLRLNDIRISQETLENAVVYFLGDLQKQYGDNYRLVEAECNPIFNEQGEVFLEVVAFGKITKQVYGYAEGKDIKEFSHLYIFKNNTLVDSIRKISELGY